MKYTVFLTSLDICIFCLILLSRKSSATDFRHDACVPSNCGNGPNITFPFYIEGMQESYCGYPGFHLNCGKHGYPTISLPENDYIVENISYPSRSFRVYNAAVLSNLEGRCLPQIRNTTLPVREFQYVNVTNLYLLSNCIEPLPKDLSPYKVDCQGENRDNLDLAIWDMDENLQNGLENCEKNVVAPVEVQGDEERIVVGEYEEILRRGFELNWKASDCSTCQRDGGRCGFNTATNSFRCFCPDGPHRQSCGIADSGRRKLKLILIAVVLVAPTVLFFIILFAFNKRKYMLYLKEKMQNDKDIDLFLKNNEILATRRYNYFDIKKMTNSFRDNLGEGGFARVYRGKLSDGRLVAVKILKESKGFGEEFINEVASISRTSHINIVTLLGFCFEGSKRALIYEFMPNGSLEKFIFSRAECQLGWEQLFQIALGIAHGIEYLHQGCNTRILHFDIKPHNILLDKDFNPKISDFGLARLCPNRSSIVSMPGARGTIGYIAPEIVCRNFGNVSYKSDVYSYGMMILEMAGETKNIKVGIDHSSENYFPDWIYKNLEQSVKLDLNIIVNANEHLRIRKMLVVGLWCIHTDPTARPSMSRVIEMLEGNIESLQIPPKPNFFLQPREALNPSISKVALTLSEVHGV
ncbi:LEAF RUST 10 DISEASE-RESISTANCE LOCUS RECEPTOR-LIKE PROTEIN KINASE-like 2.1 [Olea europaea var. sylvestris]|uniref:LEAF RUST 10 DISEASE-RESISTANCE LOCUS RECEPTOR-LIKE PROTEIN KINASE-like 2.1 n=1 Tax=Olea europaea var. sylvestris TaxID=158386 RepID=UPI000C1D1858|nr:LEAF RUST 10 DISEASE-RESISTANCE LOCUS RECEPTOR-LIKE PROTEIN KINASE-like 2.1 [Olea europaea var. sylvestris]